MAIHVGWAGCTAARSSLLELDDLMQVLVLKQESQRQVARHIPICLIGSLLGQPSFVLKSLMLLLFEIFILLEEDRV